MIKINEEVFESILGDILSMESASFADLHTKEDMEDAINVIRAHLTEMKIKLRSAVTE